MRRSARGCGSRQEADLAVRVPLRQPDRSAGKVPLGPAGDLFERGQQGAARVGEGVGDRQGRSLGDGAADQARVAQLTEPFILVHEGRFRRSEMAGKDTRHPHRGFDNLWYVLQGSASTGHTTGPSGSTERAQLAEGSLLWLRTGRGAWHAEAEFR